MTHCENCTKSKCFIQQNIQEKYKFEVAYFFSNDNEKPRAIFTLTSFYFQKSLLQSHQCPAFLWTSLNRFSCRTRCVVHQKKKKKRRRFSRVHGERSLRQSGRETRDFLPKSREIHSYVLATEQAASPRSVISIYLIVQIFPHSLGYATELRC